MDSENLVKEVPSNTEPPTKSKLSKDANKGDKSSKKVNEETFMLECWPVIEMTKGASDEEMRALPDKVMSTMKLAKNHYGHGEDKKLSKIGADIPAIARSVVPVDVSTFNPEVSFGEMAWLRMFVFALFGGVTFQVITVVATAYSSSNSVAIGNGVVSLLVTVLYLVPYQAWPTMLARKIWTNKWAELATRYFSYRIVVEERVAATETRPVIYVLGTCSDYWWSIPATLQVLVHQSVFGAPLCMLVSFALMHLPFFNVLLQCLGCMNLEDNKAVDQGRHVIVPLNGEVRATKIPLNVPEAKAPVVTTRNSLKHTTPMITKRVTHVKLKGTMPTIERLIASREVVLVPCYCFGGDDIFAGSPFVPYRTSLLTVFGKPIIVPKRGSAVPASSSAPVSGPESARADGAVGAEAGAEVGVEERLATEFRRLYDCYKGNYSVLWTARQFEVS